MYVYTFFCSRTKDYTAPVNFVSAGLRKAAAEEKQQQEKEEGGSDDSEDDGPSAPPPARGTAPKKLQMVNLVVSVLVRVAIYSVIVCCHACASR